MGQDHIARAVIQADFATSDPFILLMDDQLDKKTDEPVGGPHPHAGFETVTLILEGELGDDDHSMKTGDFQIMTAGSGIVHTETIEKKIKMRILQMWLNLPKQHRWAQPRVQDIRLESVPKLVTDDLNIKVYSGSFAGLRSPIQNYVPLIIADIQLKPGVSTTQLLPASFSAFMYVIDGSVTVGDDQTVIHQDQVGWLNKTTGSGQSELQLTAGEQGARLILYAAQPQHDPIVSYGPFIADTQDEIRGLYRDFRQGKMEHVSVLPQSQQYVY
ncbi:pirin family protein [Spirosoma daeguense]